MALDTVQKRESYAVGINFGNQLQHLVPMVDLESLLAGIRVMLEQKQPEISVEEFQTLVQQFEAKVQAQAAANFQAVADKNLQDGLEFLEKNKSEKGWQTTESGLQFKVIAEGEGESPKSTDVVKVHYEGTFIDGNFFDSSYKRGEAVTFPLNGVIKGWTEGLQLMKVGGIFDFVIPAELAYGMNPNPQSPIPPNAVLKFRVDLIAIEAPVESENTVSFS